MGRKQGDITICSEEDGIEVDRAPPKNSKTRSQKVIKPSRCRRLMGVVAFVWWSL